MNNEAENLLKQVLAKHEVSHALYDLVLKEEKTRVHLLKRRGIVEQLRHVIEQSQSKEVSK